MQTRTQSEVNKGEKRGKGTGAPLSPGLGFQNSANTYIQ